MNNIRAYFPFFTGTRDKNYIYFDNAATTQKPKEVLDALTDFYINHSAPVHRGIYKQAEQTTELYESARTRIAHFIHAQSDEIIFTKNATEGINLVAQAWAAQNLKAGDVILVSELEHHSNLLPWIVLAQQKQLKLQYIPITSDGLLDYEAYKNMLTRSVKLVACTARSNVLGSRVNIDFIIQEAHKIGATVLIDAAQAAPHEAIDVSLLQPDFLVFSGHKMLGPTGIGVLYIAREKQKQMSTYQVGGGMVYHVHEFDATWLNSPHKFEAGTPPIAQVIGLAHAIKFLEKEVDFEKLKKHEAQLCGYLITELQKLSRITILGPVKQLIQHGHLVSFIIENMHAHDVAHYLDMHDISVRAGNHCAQPLHKKLAINSSLRVSFYAYNTQEEVEILVRALRKLCEKK